MKPQAWPGGSCRAHAGSSLQGWLRTRWGWWLPWVPGCLSPPRPSFTTPGAVERRELNTPPRFRPPLLAPAKLSLQTLHWSKCCASACVSYKTHSSTSVSLRLAQAPNTFCTDMHHTVSPVVCLLQGRSQEEQGRAAKIISSFWIQGVTDLSSGRCSRHHPAAVCLAVWHTTSSSKTRNSFPPSFFVYWGLLHGEGLWSINWCPDAGFGFCRKLLPTGLQNAALA